MKQFNRLVEMVRKLQPSSTSSLVDLSVEVTKAIHKARAAGLSRADVACVIEQTLQSQSYVASIKEKA